MSDGRGVGPRPEVMNDPELVAAREAARAQTWRHPIRMKRAIRRHVRALWDAQKRADERSGTPHPPTPYVTLTLTLERQNAEALLSQEGLFPESYTALGTGWMDLMQALREALEGGRS